MSTATWFILSLGIVAAGVVIVSLFRGTRVFLRTRGKRLVTCPENHCVAAVELDAKGAGLRAVRGGDFLCLQDCSRWPERQNCGQECLSQVEELGEGCLVRNIVADWYKGKTCVYCHKPVDDSKDWAGHIPALLTPEARTVSWEEVPAEKLPEIFVTHQPVCWSCHIAESFRRQHPELVVDRPARW
jgi:hypothetical protein